MSDDTARAVGSGEVEGIIIAGKECRFRPLTIRELGEIERECLKSYKRQYLETFSDNADLLPNGDGYKLMAEKQEIAARWDISDLPPKYVYNARRLKITDELRDWILDVMGIEKIDSKGNPLTEAVLDRIVRANAVTCLDSQQLTEDKYRELTGETPRKVKVNYPSWWMTGTHNGMRTLIWECLRANGVTKEEVEKAISDNPSLLAYAARSIENLSSPSVGNG